MVETAQDMLTAKLTKMGNANKNDLLFYADEKYALAVDASLDVAVIVACIVDVDRVRRKEAGKLNEESTAMMVKHWKLKHGNDDPGANMVTVDFAFREFPTADLRFIWDGDLGVRGPVNVNGLPKAQEFHLFPGQPYDLPLCVVKHLRSLLDFDAEPIIDEASGQIKGTRRTIKPRFRAGYILTDEQVASINRASEDTTDKSPSKQEKSNGKNN